jgi:hypothetical protein
MRQRNARKDIRERCIICQMRLDLVDANHAVETLRSEASDAVGFLLILAPDAPSPEQYRSRSSAESWRRL